MVELLSIVGVFLAIEGALYAGAPSAAKKIAYQISQMDEGQLRNFGLIALGAGIFLVWLVRG